MIDTRVVSQDIQDKILDQVRKGQEQMRKNQETMAEAFKNWTATAQSITPQLPRPTWTTRLPKPEELMANAQEFAAHWLAVQWKSSEQLFAAQKKFAEEAFDAVKPLLALASAPHVIGGKPAARQHREARHRQGQHRQGQHRQGQHRQAGHCQGRHCQGPHCQGQHRQEVTAQPGTSSALRRARASGPPHLHNMRGRPAQHPASRPPGPHGTRPAQHRPARRS